MVEMAMGDEQEIRLELVCGDRRCEESLETFDALAFVRCSDIV